MIAREVIEDGKDVAFEAQFKESVHAHLIQVNQKVHSTVERQASCSVFTF